MTNLLLRDPCSICEREIPSTEACARISIHGEGPSIIVGAALQGPRRSLERGTMHLRCVPAELLAQLRKVVTPDPEPDYRTELIVARRGRG